MTKAIYLAIPSHKALYLSGQGEKAFAVTIFEWDYGHRYERHIEGDELFIECHIRGQRKRLREILYMYGFNPRTVVR